MDPFKSGGPIKHIVRQAGITEDTPLITKKPGSLQNMWGRFIRLFKPKSYMKAYSQEFQTRGNVNVSGAKKLDEFTISASGEQINTYVKGMTDKVPRDEKQEDEDALLGLATRTDEDIQLRDETTLKPKERTYKEQQEDAPKLHEMKMKYLGKMAQREAETKKISTLMADLYENKSNGITEIKQNLIRMEHEIEVQRNEVKRESSLFGINPEKPKLREMEREYRGLQKDLAAAQTEAARIPEYASPQFVDEVRAKVDEWKNEIDEKAKPGLEQAKRICRIANLSRGKTAKVLKEERMVKVREKLTQFRREEFPELKDSAAKKVKAADLDEDNTDLKQELRALHIQQLALTVLSRAEEYVTTSPSGRWELDSTLDQMLDIATYGEPAEQRATPVKSKPAKKKMREESHTPVTQGSVNTSARQQQTGSDDQPLIKFDTDPKENKDQ